MRLRTLALALVVLAALIPAPATGAGREMDGNNTFETATQLGASGYISDTVNEVDDRSDFYRLTASAGTIINISIFIHDWDAADPAKVNFELYLFTPMKQMAAFSASKLKYDSVAALAVMSGTYYIAVNVTAGSGAYTLDYSTGQARIVTTGMTIKGYLNTASNHYSDWYRVELKGDATPDEFVATLHEDPTAYFDLYFMDLWSNYSFWYDISWWNDPDEKVDAIATYSGWYYFQVHAFQSPGASAPSQGNYTLNITVQPASGGDGDGTPAGAKEVPYNSTLNGRVDQALDHYDFYKMSLAQGETVTAVVRLDPMPGDMFALSLLNPDLTTLDGKTNFVSSTPPSLDSTMSIQKSAPAAGTYYLVVMAKVALKSNIVDLADWTARSDYTINLSYSAHPNAPTNYPPAAKAPGMTKEIDRNTELSLAMGTLFTDQDGDTLRFTVPAIPHMTVSFTAGMMTVVPERNWYGSANFTITAFDPYNQTAAAWLDITVRNTHLPPEITARLPAVADQTASNGTSLVFSISATDPDGMPVTYGWAVGGISQAGSAGSFTWKANQDSGVVAITGIASNGLLSSNATWNVTCSPRIQLRVSIISPFNDTNVTMGSEVYFYAMVPGLPAAEMANYKFVWYLDGLQVSETPSFTKADIPAGKHRVSVKVTKPSEPTVSAESRITLTVLGSGTATGDMTIPIIGIVVLVAVIGLSYYAFSTVEKKRRRRRDELEEAGSFERKHRHGKHKGKRHGRR